MPLHKDDSGRRWVEMEFLVPGTPEQVWQAMATGPGMTAWFTPTTVDEHVGGSLTFDFGGDNCGTDTSSGTVTGWDPPVRFAYEEHDWSGEAPPVATEVVITARSGDRCVVRMVHSLFTDRDDWDDELESFEGGWPGFIEVLRVYLAEFANRTAATVRVMAGHSDGDAAAWSLMTTALNLVGADVGERRATEPNGSGVPALAGTVERIRQDGQCREMLLRLDEPSDGIAVLGSYRMGDDARGMVSIYLYGDDARAVAKEQRTVWGTWLNGLLS